MLHPLTDILVLVHNNLPVTQAFTEKLFQHTENYNLIFINNGSTDNVVNFLKQGADSGKWKLVDLPENMGVINGRNIAATYVTADYFLNIDNDQFVAKDWLVKLHNRMKIGYDIVGVEAWCLFPPGSGQLIFDGQSHKRDYFPMKQCKTIDCKFTYVGCGGMLIKKTVYDEIGLFDEMYNPAYFEDPDFVFRCIQHGFKVGWEPKTGIVHLAHQTMANQKTFQKNKQLIKSWKKFQEKWSPYFPAPLSI